MSLAQRLPFDVVYLILQSTAEPDEVEWQHGGMLIGWDSQEQVSGLARVCHAWKSAAYALLYNSVSIQGSAALAFTKSIRSRPDLGARVRRIVVGVGRQVEENRYQRAADDALLRSNQIMDALESLPNNSLKHFVLRPLHVAVRDRLVKFMARTALESFVCAGRVTPSAPPSWTIGLLLPGDCLKTLTPALLRLEYSYPGDATLNASVGGMENLSLEQNPALQYPQRLNIRQLRLYSPTPPADLYRLLRATAHSLKEFKIESEVRYDKFEMAKFLKQATQLRQLTYLSNIPMDENDAPAAQFTPDDDPTRSPLLIDMILSHLPNLVQLSVSSKDISINFLPLIPPSLRYLKIHCFGPDGFTHSQQVLDHLADNVRGLKSDTRLKTWVVRDIEERWGEERVEQMELACEKRGIRFVWIADDEESDSSDARFSHSDNGSGSA